MKKTTFFYKKISLTVEVAVGVDGDSELVSDEALKASLEGLLNEREDGRQWFSVEMLKDGLVRTIESSIRRAVDSDASRRFPTRANLDGTSFSCRLSDFRMRRLAGVHLTGEVVVDGPCSPKRTIPCAGCGLDRWVEIDPSRFPGKYELSTGSGACECPNKQLEVL